LGPSPAVRLGLLARDPDPVLDWSPQGVFTAFKADFGARKEILGNLGPILEHAPKAVRGGYDTMMAAASDAESIFGLF